MTKPIQILQAWTQPGWDAHSHLINDAAMREIEGLSYSTVAHAMRAARARADRRGFAAIRYLDTRVNEIWVRGDDPVIPGRRPLLRFEGLLPNRAGLR